MAKYLILLMFLPALSLAEEKEQCTIQDSGGGATIVACKNYVITKTPKSTTICRLPAGSPRVYCEEVINK